MFRIKYLLGSLLAVFSLVYLLFGIVGAVDGRMDYAEMLGCFALGSLHLGGGCWLILSSIRESRAERARVEQIIRQMIRINGGRLIATELAERALISNDDAREYLQKRARMDVSVVMQSAKGDDVFFFGQQFWNN